MPRLLLCALLAAASCSAASWTEYRVGPFLIASNAGDKQARDRLDEMEQLRHVLGVMLGKDSLGVGGPAQSQLEMLWPVQIVLFANSKEYAPHALKRPFIEGGSTMLGAWTADAPLPRDLLRALTQMLVEQNAGRMSESVETALCDLFSTIKVTGTKVMLGAPLPAGELSPERLHAWAKLQMLATQPEYSGKVRVYLNNLQGVGDEVLATRNAFGLTIAQLDEKVDAYVRAGHFEAASVSGESISPAHDFIEKQLDKAAVDSLIGELSSDGKTFPPNSIRGLAAKGDRASLEQAIKMNPRWAEAHYLMAQVELENAEIINLPRIKELKLAASLDPRNPLYWQELAKAQVEIHQYADADKSWTAAMKAAPNQAERDRINKIRLDLDEKRASFEASEKKRIADEQARDLERIKASAAAEVHAAEAAANKKLGGLKASDKPISWWEDPPGEKLSGSLSKVDCLTGGALRLTILIDGGGTIRLLVRDPKHLSMPPSSTNPDGPQFACGAQRTARAIRVVYTLKADAKLDTVGDVAMVDFP